MIDFDKDVITQSHESPVVVQFTADWCGPCRVMKPIIKRVQEQRGDFDLVFVDVDKQTSLAVRHGVRGIPAILSFMDGKPVSKYMSVPSHKVLNDWLDSFIIKEGVNEQQSI